MKKILLIFLLLSVHLLAVSGNNIGGDILQEFKSVTNTWWDVFDDVSLYLFWTLASIELVIVFGMMLVGNELELGGIFKALIKIILLFGFFQIFYQNKDWIIAIVTSFEVLGNEAGGMTVSLDKITDYAFDVWTKTSEAVSIFDGVGEAIFNSIAGFLAGGAVLGLGISMLVVYAKFYIMLNASVLFIAFGAFNYTRQYAINALVGFLKIGVELMLIKLVIALSIQVLPATAAAAMENDSSMFTTLIVATIFFAIAQMIPDMVGSIFNGTNISSNNTAGSMLKQSAMRVGSTAGAGAMGAAAGVGAASEHVKAAKASGGGSTLGNAGRMMAGTVGGMAGGAVAGARGHGMAGASLAGEKAGGMASGGMQKASKEIGEKVRNSFGGSKGNNTTTSSGSGTIEKGK